MARCTALFGVVFVGVLVPGAGQGSAQVAPVNHIVVHKVVEGPAPAGAVFVVHVGCTNEAMGAPTLSVLDETFSFDARGNPPAVTLDVPTNLTDNGFVLCGVSETSGFAPGVPGAPNPYDCQLTSPGTSNPSGGPEATCGLSRSEAGVLFPFSRVDAVATVTITNRFEEPPPPPIVPMEPITLAPTFTG